MQKFVRFENILHLVSTTCLFYGIYYLVLRNQELIDQISTISINEQNNMNMIKNELEKINLITKHLHDQIEQEKLFCKSKNEKNSGLDTITKQIDSIILINQNISSETLLISKSIKEQSQNKDQALKIDRSLKEYPKGKISVQLIDSKSRNITSFSLNPPKNKKWLISFGLYGNNTKYTEGAIENAKLAKEIYPGWDLRFYVGTDVQDSIIQKLKTEGAEVIIMKQQTNENPTLKKINVDERNKKHQKDRSSEEIIGDTAGMFWRFLPEDDLNVDRFIVRDSDSRLNFRERGAVYEWIISGKSIHIMRDHIGHKDSMPGGMWGAVRGKITEVSKSSMKDLILDWSNGSRNKFFDDMNFLNDFVWPLIKDDYLGHDSFYCEQYGAISFPTERLGNLDFVGQVLQGKDGPVRFQIIEEAPEKCRRHINWKRG